MDKITSAVREMYTEYPFPDEDYNMPYGIQLLRYFAQIAPNGQRSALDKARILDAGCGTGSVSVGLAKQFPGASVLSVDMTEASLAIAPKKAADAGVGNIEFQQRNLLELDLDRQFDAIFCIGVLHHLSDPARGLRALARHLAPGGHIALWLYGRHGRYRLNLNQRMLSLMLAGCPSLEERVRLVKLLLKDGPQDALNCHFNVGRGNIENDWPKARDWLLERDSWIVDQFLHRHELTYAMEDILAILKDSGLVLDRWLGHPEDMSRIWGVPELAESFNTLDRDSQLVAADLLLKPDYYTLICKAL